MSNLRSYMAMTNYYKKIKRDIVEILKKVDLLRYETLEETLEKPPQPAFGDISSDICFSLSRKLKEPLQKLAEEVVSKIAITPSSLIARVEARGGYVNFCFDYTKLSAIVLRAIHDLGCRYGSSDIGKGKKVIVEFPSVNPGKPWHVGHARNVIIGDSVQRIMKFSGFDVESQNYIDDLGLQVAQVLWGILDSPKRKLPKKAGLLKKEDQWQGRIYVRVANLFEEDIESETRVRELMKKMEFGDSEVRRKLSEVVELCLKAQYQTAFRLGVCHNLKVHESDIVASGLYDAAIETILRSEKIVKEESGPNAGCVVAKLGELPEFGKMKSPDKILIRSDGTATYACKDLAYQMWKFGLIKDHLKFEPWLTQPNRSEVWTTAAGGKPREDFGHADIVINVIGSEQRYPQKVISHILNLLGYEEAFENSIHLAHEPVWLKGEGRKNLSGRSGTWIGFTADEVLDESSRRARNEVEKRNPDLSGEEKKEIAESVGRAAFRFPMLSTSLDKAVEFDYNRALSLKGDTGPYLQYAYTRICGILRKAKDWNPTFEISDLTDHERKLIRLLLEFPETVEESARDLKSYIVCKYAYELATALDKFYEVCPVLRAETEDLRNYRATLIDATRVVLENAFNLIGIEPLERM